MSNIAFERTMAAPGSIDYRDFQIGLDFSHLGFSLLDSIYSRHIPYHVQTVYVSPFSQ